MSLSYISTQDPRDLYHNVVVAIDRTKDINNGQPSALAWWIKALELMPGDRACHLGCGVGYYTAIMVEVVGPNGSMLGIEVNEDLARHAKQNLAEYPNVTVRGRLVLPLTLAAPPTIGQGQDYAPEWLVRGRSGDSGCDLFLRQWPRSRTGVADAQSTHHRWNLQIESRAP